MTLVQDTTRPMLRIKAIFRGRGISDSFDASVARGVRPELAKVTLARKIASVTLTLWKKGELWAPKKLTMQTT